MNYVVEKKHSIFKVARGSLQRDAPNDVGCSQANFVVLNDYHCTMDARSNNTIE
jgi:hypothetical protein